MAKHYRIKPGATFRDGDTVKASGALIELELDMAQLHRDKIEEVEEVEDLGDLEPVQTSAPAPDPEG